MKKLKKRLPALLLSLVFAVMPLMMATPANAAEYVCEYDLSSFLGMYPTAVYKGDAVGNDVSIHFGVGSFPLSHSCSFDYGTQTPYCIYFEGFEFYPVSLFAGDRIDFVYYFPVATTSFGSVDYFANMITFASGMNSGPESHCLRIGLDASGSLSFYNGFDFSSPSLDRLPLLAEGYSCKSLFDDDGSLIGVHVSGALLADVDYISHYANLYRDENYSHFDYASGSCTLSFSSYDDLKMLVTSSRPPAAPDSVDPDPADVLSVFSGIGSWLAGTVNSMSAMFWTAEGGLSVLGVLAIASLALSFVLLLILFVVGC